MKNGKGLERLETHGLGPHLPIERPDILSELKQFADVHRMSRFAMRPEIIPVVVVGAGARQSAAIPQLGTAQRASPIAAQFIQIEIWNETNDYNLRLVGLHINTQGDDTVNMYRNLGARLSAGVKSFQLLDPRFTLPGGRILASINFLSAAAQFVGTPLGTFNKAHLGPLFLPQEWCETIVIPPNTGVFFEDNVAGVATTLGISPVIQAEPLKDTQPQGTV